MIQAISVKGRASKKGVCVCLGGGTRKSPVGAGVDKWIGIDGGGL